VACLGRGLRWSHSCNGHMHETPSCGGRGPIVRCNSAASLYFLGLLVNKMLPAQQPATCDSSTFDMGSVAAVRS
jgi:hypothetical protein